MALAAATLASGLFSMAPTDNESDAIQAFVDAWEVYFDKSLVGGIAAIPGSYSAALSAMTSAMSGCSETGQGAAKIGAALTAFWSSLSSVATAVWITAPVVLVPPVVPPPSLAGVSGAVSAVFGANTTGQVTLVQSAQNLANALHASAGIGGLIPGSTPPAPPAPIPIR
jgi:hypothetical protein